MRLPVPQVQGDPLLAIQVDVPTARKLEGGVLVVCGLAAALRRHVGWQGAGGVGDNRGFPLEQIIIVVVGGAVQGVAFTTLLPAIKVRVKYALSGNLILNINFLV